MSVKEMFPFALILAVTRRRFCFGSSLLFYVSSVAIAIIDRLFVVLRLCQCLGSSHGCR